MDSSQNLAIYFESLVEQCNREPECRPIHLPKHDQIIYYIISTRCEMDINCFDSVFDQLLTEQEIRILIEGLEELGARNLAAHFDQVHARLKSVGFFDDESMMVMDLDEADSTGFLDDIEKAIDQAELWDLDEKLLKLIPSSNE